MKVALIGPSLEQRGGIVSVLRALRQWLVDHDFEVTLIRTTSDGGFLSRLAAFWAAWLSIVCLCITRNCDLVHLHMASRGSCFRKGLLALVCIALHMPYVIHLHGGKFQEFYSSELSSVGRLIVRVIFQRAARVVALSKVWKTWIESEIGVRDVAVVFNGVDSACDSVECSVKEQRILFLGRLVSQKGMDELLAAMDLVLAKIPNAVLELGGDGDVEHYKKLTSGLQNIRYLGWVDEAGRRAAFVRATVFCLPSWNEGLPMSILEAMSAGLPVVSTTVGGIPEAVTDGVSGLLVSPKDTVALADALCKLLSDPNLVRAMGQEGKKRQLVDFSLDAMGEKCVEVYRHVLRH
jgi:polysaccharide biosynthesis protein VpsI